MRRWQPLTQPGDQVTAAPAGRSPPPPPACRSPPHTLLARSHQMPSRNTGNRVFPAKAKATAVISAIGPGGLTAIIRSVRRSTMVTALATFNRCARCSRVDQAVINVIGKAPAPVISKPVMVLKAARMPPTASSPTRSCGISATRRSDDDQIGQHDGLAGCRPPPRGPPSFGECTESRRAPVEQADEQQAPRRPPNGHTGVGHGIKRERDMGKPAVPTISVKLRAIHCRRAERPWSR